MRAKSPGHGCWNTTKNATTTASAGLPPPRHLSFRSLYLCVVCLTGELRPRQAIKEEYSQALENFVGFLDDAAGWQWGQVVEALVKAREEDAKKDAAADGTRPGRPPATRIEPLEKEIRRQEARIPSIKDGGESCDSSNRGRPGQTPKQKICGIELKIRATREQVREEERKLTEL